MLEHSIHTAVEKAHSWMTVVQNLHSKQDCLYCRLGSEASVQVYSLSESWQQLRCVLPKRHPRRKLAKRKGAGLWVQKASEQG